MAKNVIGEAGSGKRGFVKGVTKNAEPLARREDERRNAVDSPSYLSHVSRRATLKRYNR